MSGRCINEEAGKELKRIEQLPPRVIFRFLSAVPRYLFHRLRKDGRSCPPLVITIELTRRCNLSCPYCYLDKNGEREELINEETIAGILAGFPGPPPVVHLTGGEPFLRTDLSDIVSRVQAAGSCCAVSTNGTLISRRNTPWLETAAPDRFTISLNGPAGVHDRVTGSPGSFRRTMEGIGYLAELGLLERVSVNFLFHHVNLDATGEFLRLVGDTGIRTAGFLHPMTPASGRESSAPAGCGDRTAGGPLDPGRMAAAVEFIRREGKRRGIGIRFVPELDSPEILRWYSGGYVRSCRYPYFAVRIDPAGEVYPCHNFRNSLGNARAGRLLEIWNGTGYRRFRAGLGRFPRPAGCANCCKI